MPCVAADDARDPIEGCPRLLGHVAFRHCICPVCSRRRKTAPEIYTETWQQSRPDLDSPAEGTFVHLAVPPRTERPWEGPPKSILAISDLTLGGSTDRADVPI